MRALARLLGVAVRALAVAAGSVLALGLGVALMVWAG